MTTVPSAKHFRASTVPGPITVQAADPRRLMWMLPPIAGESLMGWIVRSADDNVHENSRAIMSEAGAPHHRYFDIAARDEFRADRLAIILGADEREIRLRMHGAEGNHSGAPRVSFFGASVPRHDLTFRTRLVSPTSLRASPHHHALATHGLVPFCPETGEWLIGSCPFCPSEKPKKLGWYRTLGVATCEHCGGDLREAPADLVDPKALSAALPLVGLIDPNPHAQALALDCLPEVLRNENRGVLFELGWRLGRIVVSGSNGARDKHRKLTSSEKLATLGQGASMLARWPFSMDEAVKSCFGEGPHESALDLAVKFRKLANTQAGWPEHTAIFKRDAPHILRPSHGAVRRLMHDGLDGRQAARFLGLNSGTFIELHRAVRLPVLVEKGVRNVHATFSATALAPLRDAIAARITAGAVSEDLRISLHGVEQLVCLGLLNTVQHPGVAHLYAGLQIDGASFDRLRVDLASSAARSGKAKSNTGAARRGAAKWMPLKQAMLSIGGREKPWGPVIAAMLDGSLIFRLASSSGRLTRRLSVRRSDLPALIKLAFDRPNFPGFPFADTMSRRDGQETLNLTPQGMNTAIHSDLKHCHEGRKRLNVAAVQTLAAERIGGGEILARWCGGRRSMPLVLSSPLGPKRLGITGWSRPDVEQVLGPAPPMRRHSRGMA